MIIIKVNGGLGNQLQQYALYEKMKAMGKEVKLDFTWFEKDHESASKRGIELELFPGVTYEAASKEEINKILGNRSLFAKGLEKLHLKTSPLYVEHQMYDPSVFTMDQKILEGYWACEGYYADRIPNLQEQLQFPSNLSPENLKMKEEMQGCNSVSLHIRRGDYLKKENREMFGGICTEEYYEAALKWIKDRVDQPRFYIFSDDPSYTKEKYRGPEYRVVDINRGKDSYLDLYLMSQCRHNICANSTFSFWGARLNQNPGKSMIRPLKQKNCDWYEPEKMKQLWKGWILIDEEGKEWQ